MTKVDWMDIVRPETVSVILGKTGSGKSGTAYYLVERCVAAYQLTPVIVGFPAEKRRLLPAGYQFKTLSEAMLMENAVVLVDEGSTQLPAGGAMDELLKSMNALSRQRSMALLLIFHASRDVGSKVLRGIGPLIFKEPSRRQIQFGSKNKDMRLLLEQAYAAFRNVAGRVAELQSYSFVDSETPDFQGMLENPLPAYFTRELSTAWKGVNLAIPGAGSLQEEGELPAEETVSDYLARMRQEAPQAAGADLECCICHAKAALLYSGTCERCFDTWALSARKMKKEDSSWK